MKWREHPWQDKPAPQRRIYRKPRERKIYALERTITVSGVVDPVFLERMRLLGVRVKRVDG
jgi:hypothetical protein